MKILHLADIAGDADLVAMILKESGIDADILVVNNKSAYIQALMEFSPNVILSDFKLLLFNSAEALDILAQTEIKIPFIFVTSNASVSNAVSLIKAGANDYILKDQLAMLPQAIIGSLESIQLKIDLENKNTLKIKAKTNSILVAQEAERSQVAYELLENVNQILAACNLYIDCALGEKDRREVFMQNSKKNILLAIDEVDKLSQVIMPPILKEIGLIESLKNWIAFKQKPGEINFTTAFENFTHVGVEDELQLTIFRIAQEQINHTVKYSNAKNIHISLEQTEDYLELMIKDDGAGFDTRENANDINLENIKTRAEIRNGKMLFNSGTGKSSMLNIVFPI